MMNDMEPEKLPEAPAVEQTTTLPVSPEKPKKFQLQLLLIPLFTGIIFGLSTVVWLLLTQESSESDTPTPPLVQVQEVEQPQEAEPVNLQTLRQIRNNELQMQIAFPSSWSEPQTSNSNNRPQILLDNRLRISRGQIVSPVIDRELTLGELLLEEQLPGKVSLASAYQLNSWQGTKFIYTDEQNQILVKIFLATSPQSTDIVIIDYPLPTDQLEELKLLQVLQDLVIETFGRSAN